MNFKRGYLPFLVFISSFIYSQIQVGEISPDFSGTICANATDETEDVWNLYQNGGGKVTCIMQFTSWDPSGQLAASNTQDLMEENIGLYGDQFNFIANGFDWSSYSCSEWVDEFGLTYPILDGGDSGGEPWNLYGDGYVPHFVVIGHDYEVLYSAYVYSSSDIQAAINTGISQIPIAESGLFFSEYGEGDGNNRYLEIFNGTGSDIDLSDYSLSYCINGCGTPGVFDYPDDSTFFYDAGGFIAAGDVYVIAHPGADAPILEEADYTYPSYFSNGDDAFALTLAGATADNYTIIDIIGYMGYDPGSGWEVAGVLDGTKNHTLVRKGNQLGGNYGNFAASAGTNTENSEWIVLEQNDWNNLGFFDSWEEVISGCTDPLAENYDENASIDDGSCEYPDNGDYALSFDSPDEYVNISGYDLTGEISDITVSVDAALKSGTRGNLWSQVDGGELNLRFDSTNPEFPGQPFIRAAGKFGSWQYIYIENNLDSEFHNFTLVYSRLNQFLSVYIDYVLIQTLDLNTSEISSVDAYDDNFGLQSDGQLLIDNVTLWHGTAFTESQIMDNGSALADLISPSGLWKMNSGSGDLAYDQTGNNHGTIVGASWQPNDVTSFRVPEDYSGIMEAMEYVTEGDTIFVAQGEYYETVIFPEFEFYLIGEDHSNTFINGEGYQRGLIIENAENAFISGFTIRDGDSGDSGDQWDNKGGGIVINNSNNITILSCSLEGNWSNNWGGGAYFNNSQIEMIDCVVRNNYTESDGGGLAIENSTVDFSNVSFNDNVATNGPGGAIVSYGSVLNGINLVFYGNFAEEGSAFYLHNTSYDLIHILAYQNSSSTSTFVFDETAGYITNSTFFDNNVGGSIFEYHGGAEGSNTISNSVIRNNIYELAEEGEGQNNYFGEVIIYNSNIEGEFECDGCEGIIDLNPLFCNLEDHDFSLAENSPCLAENNEFNVNMGAIGIGCEAIILEPEVTISDNDFQDLNAMGYGILMEEDGMALITVLVEDHGAELLEISSGSDNDSLGTEVLDLGDGTYSLQITPNPDWFGMTEVFVAVMNEVGVDTSRAWVLVEGVNDAPVIADIADQVTDEDTPLRILLSITDVDNEYIDFHVRDDMLYNIDAYIVSNGDSLLLIPHPNWHGEETVQIVAHDGELEVQNSFTLTVNPVDDDPMVSGYMPDLYFYEDFQEVFREDLRGLFEDIDGELTFSVSLENENILHAEVEGDTMLTLSSLANANGITEMHITASNPTRASVTDTVLVTVFEVNDPPVIAEMVPITMAEDTPYEFMSMASLFETGLITDVDNSLEELTFHLHSESEHVFIDWDGEVTSMPMILSDQDYFGPGLLNLCVMDSYDEMCMMIDVEVNPVNDAPYFVSEMHAPVGVTLEFNLMLDAMDVDSENLTVSLTDGETNPAFVSVTDNMLMGTPDELGMFPVYLSLSDGEITSLDTFELHVVNFVPEIVAIEDIPNDQGGRVYVAFTASFMDMGEEGGQNYDVYRYDTIGDQSGWVMVTSGSAIGSQEYVFEVTTLMDSTSEGNGMSQFKVVASMNNGIFHSEPMMGYSIDNIAPGVPDGLIAVAMDDNIQLSWNPSPDEDFQYYVVEKSMEMSFADMESFEVADTSFIDVEYVSNQTNYYRLVTIDHAGNHSDYSTVVEATVLSIDENTIPEVFALHQNYPNPFNPMTQIKYDLPEDGLVTINIYDVMGRSIKTLVNDNQSAGYRSVRWDATNNYGEAISAGMYIYVIQAGEFRQTKKMVLLK